jgi:Tfp pilus assembly protein PilV
MNLNLEARKPVPFVRTGKVGLFGFTLIEVLIASTLFFVGAFVILNLVSQCLRSVSSLQDPSPNAGMLAAELSLTNKLVEGTDSGDFGDIYPGYSWERNVAIAPDATNALYQVDFTIYKSSGRGRGVVVDSELHTQFYRP